MTEEEQLLRKLRGRLAYSKGVEPYVIFNDHNLSALLEARPTSLAELVKVKGFPEGKARVTKWGQAIVDVFTKKGIEDFDVQIDKDGDPCPITKMKSMELF